MIKVNKEGRGFVDAVGKPFVPVGTNYANAIGGYTAGDKSFGYSYLFGVNGECRHQDGLKEAVESFKRMADLGLNVIRLWLEPDEFFPHGTRLNEYAAARFDALLECCHQNGLYLSVGCSAFPIPSGWILHPFEEPHAGRHRMQLGRLAARWGTHPNIFSWTIVGEGTLPWQTADFVAGWPEYLRHWYNDDLEALKKAWKDSVTDFRKFADAPVPPPNPGLVRGHASVNPGKIAQLPGDAWEESRWRYDWRMYLEEIGSRRVADEVAALRGSGAQQMITVGNNCWCFPDLPAGQMARGYNPYFYLDSVDYICQHNYPAPSCWEGGHGDPLSSPESMDWWLKANQIMGRIYSSLGKPVVMEEFGWYGACQSKFLCPLPHRTEKEQRDFCDRMMETTAGTFAGWLTWPQKDMPAAGDITNGSGLWKSDGVTLKEWGKSFSEWAARYRQNPPAYKPGSARRALPMKTLYTSDRGHVKFWEETVASWNLERPEDFDPVFERRPLMDSEPFHKIGSGGGRQG